jgi:hypothetical protein
MFLQLDLLPLLGHKEAIGICPWLPYSFKTGGLEFGHLSEDRQTNTGLYNIDMGNDFTCMASTNLNHYK